MSRLGFGLLVGVLLAGAARSATAQVSSTDVITGVVTNDQGQPVAEAVVEAMSLETQIVRSARTDSRGRYTILFPDGGGQYRMTIRAIGLAPLQTVIARQVDEDRLVFNVKMSGGSATQLDEIVVRGGRRGPPGSFDPPTAGSTEKAMTPDQLARLPIDAGDLALLATLAPGVVAIPGTDSTANSFSVAGQRPGDNNITLDGLSFGAGTVPQDAVRVTRVITNTYDASRGQFSGGLVSSTTRTGSNVTQGSLNYSLRDRSLVLQNDQSGSFNNSFTQHQLSFGLGGPIVTNKLWVFASGQGRFRGDNLQSLLNAPSSSLERLGASPDSVARFLSILGNDGLPVDLANESDRRTTALSGIVRIDYSISDAHTLTFRGDVRSNKQDPTRISPLSVPSTGGTQSSSGGGGMLTLNSRFGTSVINEFRAYLSGSSNQASATDAFPAGRVQVASLLDDGSSGVSTFIFGGNPGLPRSGSSTSFEGTNELSWLPRSGGHRFKLGTFLNVGSTTSDGTSNRYGTFIFNSLADFESGRPASFTRTVAPVVRSSTSHDASIYLTDQWRVSSAVQLSLGLRGEALGFGGAPALNQDVATSFGLRTDRLPSELHLSPRVGFTWVVGGFNPEAPPKWYLRGGIGEFLSRMPNQLVSAAIAAPGQGNTESQLVCIGADAPVPDWSGYRTDPGSVPVGCLGGALSAVPTRQPNVTAFNQDFSAPRAWRGSLGINRRMGLHALGLEVSYARGLDQTGFSDLNLGSPQFSLTSEGGRPVYAAAPTIDPRTGATGLFASRRDPAYGQVLRVDSDLQSESTQLTLSAQGTTRKALIYSVSYTLSRSRDQSSFAGAGGGLGFSSATTGGDPNAREWARSDFERRHSFLATATYPVTNNLELTTIARLTSGAPYTPVVSADINGDGSRNDRAFIFGPNAADTAVADGMARLLAGTGAGVRACLERQTGQIAARNSCVGPWQPSLDLQMNYRPTFLGLNQRLNISVVTSNLLAGLDELFHGAGNLQGWGQQSRPDGTLLLVDGFDPTTQRFTYVVNERFGATVASVNAIRNPFQIGIQVRYTIGPDRQRDFLRGLRGGGRGGFGGGFGGRPGGAGGPGGRGGAGGAAGMATPADFLTRLETAFPDPAAEIVKIRIALNLTDAEVTALQAVSDSFAAKIKALGEKAEAQIQKAGSNPDPQRLMLSIQPVFQELRTAHRDALAACQKALTPEQWNGVPDRVKNAGFGRGQRRRP